MQREKRESSDGNALNNALSRLDRNFLRTLYYHTEFGSVQLTEAYRLAGVSRGIFEDLRSRVYEV